MHRLMERRMAV